MLESNYEDELTALLVDLPCRIQLPTEWSDFLSENGVVAPIHDDRRRFVRHRFRRRAVLEVPQTLPSIQRPEKFHFIYTRDLSRQGVSFLHHEQLFPTEECRLWLPQKQIAVRIVSCKRIQRHCFLVGSRMGTAGLCGE